MDNNETVRRVRWALSLDDESAARLMRLGGLDGADAARAAAWRRREEDEAAEPCPDAAVAALLDGLVRERRGPDPRAGAPAPTGAAARVDNNAVLKALKVALSLRGEDVAAIVGEGAAARADAARGERRDGVPARPAPALSAAEVGSLLRRPGTRNYRACGDQVLRRFLNGLGARLRADGATGTPAGAPTGTADAGPGHGEAGAVPASRPATASGPSR